MQPDSHIPAHAASIWTEGETLCLSISGHTFRLPASSAEVLASHIGKPFDVASKTLATLTYILREREAAPKPESIGFNSNPHQTMQPELLAAITAKWQATKREAALAAAAKCEAEMQAFFQELGL